MPLNKETKLMYICILAQEQINNGWTKSSYDVISAVRDYFDQWNPSTETLMVNVCGTQVEK